ncbi:putative siderophore iron transporter [Venturia nashicola]|uniref:Putative siderophore iron transporter n=1 Tax=Venturia nashicola TaxID=86259 RepID=A0A4Z1P8V7_9PEZI|nr:putative siderophore iron transporter [Venturia nashicola]TLD37832.1 putative siderophore iron transporter [Venturia nashicola]
MKLLTIKDIHMADVGPVAEKPYVKDTNQPATAESEHHHDHSPSRDLIYENEDEEPELHARTYIALSAMFLLNFIQAFALTGPPTVLSYIGEDLNDPLSQTWIPSVFSLVQAVLCPLIASASDTFQARKTLLVVLTTISFVGAAIAPGATSIARVIAAQFLMGFGFASTALAYSVPSEILPRRWRPMAQASMNIAAVLGATSGPLAIGGLTKSNPHTGWRIFYWIMMAIWGLTAMGIFFGYRPPKRHTRLDHLQFMQKLKRLDLPGFGLLTAGLTLLLTGINLGGGLFIWKSVPVLTTLVIGIILLVVFAVHEWRFTNTGILDHELFQGGKHRGRTFAICVVLMFLEGIMVFSFFIFYPVFATRILPYWLACGVGTIAFGYWSTRARTIKLPLLVGFTIFTAGIVGLATIGPGQSLSATVFGGLAGLGVGAPLILILAGVQLSTPHHLIATATAVTTSARSVSGTAFTAIYAAALNDRLTRKLPMYIAAAALRAGLPLASVPAFVKALIAKETAALPNISGVTPAIIQAGVGGLKQAFADSIRIVYIIAAPFGLLACIGCLFLGDLRTTMSYRVDAPVEKLEAKHQRESTPTTV